MKQADIRPAEPAHIDEVCALHAAAFAASGHEALGQHGIHIVFVLGDPAYYRRFGYDPALAAPFDSPYASPCLMACVLDSGLPIPQRGHALHAAAFSRLA